MTEGLACLSEVLIVGEAVTLAEHLPFNSDSQS